MFSPPNRLNRNAEPPLGRRHPFMSIIIGFISGIIGMMEKKMETTIMGLYRV